MPADDAELVRAAFDALGTDGPEDTAAAYWDEEVEYVEDPRWPGASTYRGRDAVAACFRAYMEALGRPEDFTFEVERVVDGRHGRVAALVRFRSRSPSGVPHDHLWGYVVELRRARIVHFRAYYDAEQARDAVAGPP